MDLETCVENDYGRVARTAGPHGYHHFVPVEMPRRLTLEDDTVTALSAADLALGRLAGTGRLLPDPHLLVRPYLVKEALASSRIEGTQASQNWIGPPGAGLGDAVPVPPRHEPEMVDALADWERFLHDRDSGMPLLVACSLLHYQFETIHPFLDGNGRVGRLVVALYLLDTGVLPDPLLYVSPYLERHRDEYYARLRGVRESGDIQSWLRFFLTGWPSRRSRRWSAPSASLISRPTTALS